jgi:hypothetical protein
MLSDIIKSNDHYTIANIMYNKYFVEQISELTTKFPIDYVLDDGTSFWANKQYPHLLDEVCTLKHDFIKEFVLVCGQVNDKRLKSLAKLAYYATSLRAQNYGIALIGEFAFYKIFCNIIPKLSSMGSIIAGLALLELSKIANNFTDINVYKNNNVATNSITSSVPTSCKADDPYTIWDSIIVLANDAKTVCDFIKFFEIHYKINVSSIIWDKFMFYSMLLDDDKINVRLCSSIKEIIETEMKVTLGLSITLQIYDDDIDYDLPEILYIF